MLHFDAVTRFLLMRHGQSTFNAEGRWQGWADPPLTPLGRLQAEEAAQALKGIDFVAAATSDLRRASETAVIVTERLGLAPALVDSRLRERDNGDWQGLTREEIEAGWPEVAARWAARQRVDPPNAEPVAQVVGRSRDGLATLAAAHPDAVVLVVTHGGVIGWLTESVGAPNQRIGNVGARWFTWDAGELEAGDAIESLTPDIETAPPAV